ncbi:uncharacterized protein LOC126672758 [Mercurialis annua]|uniref:uncharacterized protein LOC126672758 n=1 Tax=Mercurialis annua TaxID=3986 RepID=UPI00215EFA39|nr:uncharacterized protein LOC126672758 [Mercurialis annua]
MATHGGSYLSASGLPEGNSITRPPLFNGSNYDYWKNRMKSFIQSQDIECWKSILYGVTPPTKVNADGTEVRKDETEFTEADWRVVQTNAKAITMIHCALDISEYNRVRNCVTAKHVWEKLQITYEGTDQVRETKINLLQRDYELFQMKSDEGMSEFSSRFSNIINGLKSLGENFTDEQLVKKILRSLTEKWESKTTAIIEAKNLKNYSFDELMGSLMTHEMVKYKGKEIAQERRKKADLALKIESESDDQISSDEEIALMTKRFSKMYRKGDKRYRNNMKKFIKGKVDLEGADGLCFGCNKPGHFKADCPKLKRSTRVEKPKKGLAAWSNSDDSDEDKPEEKANLCLMAIETGDNSGQTDAYEADSSDNEVENLKHLSYDELLHNCNDIFMAYKVVSKKYVKLKAKTKNVISEANVKISQANETEKENIMQKDFDLMTEKIQKAETEVSFLKKELETSNNLRINLLQQNDAMQKKIDLLIQDLAKFTKGKANLNMLLGNQRPYGDTGGIGFEGFTKPKKMESFLKNIPTKIKTITKRTFIPYMSHATCFYCNIKGHVSKFCKAKQKISQTKLIWVVKGTKPEKVTNPEGPKSVWVPKHA